MATDKNLLAELEWFQLLDEDDLQKLAEVIDLEPLAGGQTLFRTGEPGDSMYIVQSGAVELYVQDTAGQKIVLRVAETGDLFGEFALLDSGARAATAVAVTDSQLVVLDKDDLTLIFQRTPEIGLHLLGAMSRMTRSTNELLKTRVSRNVNEEIETKSTPLQRMADGLAWFSGSMPFLLIHAAWFTIWVSLNTFILGTATFDPFPFGLLTMIVSLEAIFLSCFVLISANRQAEKDKVRADIEYEVNIQAEKEVAHLHEKMDRAYEDILARFARLEKVAARFAPDND